METDPRQHDATKGQGTMSHDELLGQIADREVQIQIKGRLMENMAYQIRTLSNAVIGFSDLLLSEDISQNQNEYAQEINHAGYGLSALVSEVLDWVGVLSGDLTIQKTACDLTEVVDRLEQIVAAAASEKGLDHRVVRDPMLPEQIFSDDERLLRCLLNLVAIAIRNTPEGSVQVHVVMEERSLRGRAVRFDVIDSGAGIEAERSEPLLTPRDYQVSSDLGLQVLLDMGLRITAGLPLTKQLAEFLDGSIAVKSDADAGTIYSLRIPVGLSAETCPRKKASKDAWQAAETPVAPVLLVEDQQANRTVISLMLEALGVAVDTAADGVEAIGKVGKTAYSLILMDLKMPKMDGYEATRQLREQPLEVPIVALSAKVLDKHERDEIAALFDGFLMKPVDSQKLAEMLNEYVAGFRAPERDAVVLEYGN
ncbi:MAG: response regulator [Planctomycetota bacterium]